MRESFLLGQPSSPAHRSHAHEGQSQLFHRKLSILRRAQRLSEKSRFESSGAVGGSQERLFGSDSRHEDLGETISRLVFRCLELSL